jgi:haloacid dehalogenase-like hydrolase
LKANELNPIFAPDPIQSTDAGRPIAVFGVVVTRDWTDSFVLFPHLLAGRWEFFERLIAILPKLMAAFFKGMSQSRYGQLSRQFAKVAYAIIARADALAHLQGHQSIKDEVVIVSPSLDQYLVAWAQALDVKTVLSTRMEVFNGQLTGKMIGFNCRSKEKLTRIQGRFSRPIMPCWRRRARRATGCFTMHRARKMPSCARSILDGC